MAANEYYSHGAYPSTGSAGSSASMRSELDAVTAGFALLPTIAANGGKVVAINPGATALTVLSTTGTGNVVLATSPALITPTGIVKGDVGLGSVDNTSDVNKPISSATQTALNLKANTSALAAVAFSGLKADVGLSNVDNTSDVNKPVSTAAQTAYQSQLYTGFTTAGTSTAYTLTPSPAIAAYAAGPSFFVTFNSASGTAPTLAISGLATPPNLVKQLPGGTYGNIGVADIPANHRSRVTLISATQALIEKLPLRTKCITTSRDISLASGAQTISGVGFTPSRVTILTAVDGTAKASSGQSDGSTNFALGNATNMSTGTSGVDTANCIYLLQSLGNTATATMTFNSDGGVLNWVKTGAPTGVTYVNFLFSE
jgi:hypothetical protein